MRCLKSVGSLHKVDAYSCNLVCYTMLSSNSANHFTDIDENCSLGEFHFHPYLPTENLSLLS
jgi:hypothetical protein